MDLKHKTWNNILRMWGKQHWFGSSLLIDKKDDWTNPKVLQYVLYQVGIDINLEVAQVIINHFKGEKNEYNSFLNTEKGMQYYWEGFQSRPKARIKEYSNAVYYPLPYNIYNSGSLEYKAFLKGSILYQSGIHIKEGNKWELYELLPLEDNEGNVVLVALSKEVKIPESKYSTNELILIHSEEVVYEYLYQLSLSVNN